VCAFVVLRAHISGVCFPTKRLKEEEEGVRRRSYERQQPTGHTENARCKRREIKLRGTIRRRTSDADRGRRREFARDDQRYPDGKEKTTGGSFGGGFAGGKNDERG